MAKFKYTLSGAEPLIKDLKAHPDSYYDGEILVEAAAEGGGVRSAAAGIVDRIIGICNQDGTLPATSGYSQAGSTMGGGGPATLTGTQAAGTIENLKVIVNPDAVLAVEYDQSARITWGTVTDTTIPFTCANAAGFADIGGGWAWSYDTGELDYIVSSATVTTTCTLTTVTGTLTTSDYGILIQPGSTGQQVILELNADALTIDADQVDVGVAGTNGITGVILENRIESLSHGSEILDPVVHNQQKRYMTANTSYKDKARIFAYVRFKHALSV
jgi:hypothetical protein